MPEWPVFFLFDTVGGDHINPQILVSEMVCPKT